MSNKGTEGERLAAKFFVDTFTSQFSFPNPKTTANAEVADLLIWWNHVVFLIEVRTRDGGGQTPQDWARGIIPEKVRQLRTNRERLKRREVVNLHNDTYQTQLKYDGIDTVFCLLVLVCDDDLQLLPQMVVTDIYRHETPVHVFSLNDLLRMVKEIDTVADLAYYLADRDALLREGADIPIDRELHAVACYKMNNNFFPSTLPDFAGDVWNDYQTKMADAIAERDQHNEYSELWDHVMGLMPEKAKNYQGLPIGLYFAWEFAAYTRRMRAMEGQKLAKVEQWFAEGESTRKYATYNCATGNWTVFFWSKQEQRELVDRLLRIVDLKLIKEVANCGFDRAAFGLCFQVNQLLPHRFRLAGATFNSESGVKGFTPADLEEAYKEWGHDSETARYPIEEFPRPAN